jgi:hypothetical protein
MRVVVGIGHRNPSAAKAGGSPACNVAAKAATHKAIQLHAESPTGFNLMRVVVAIGHRNPSAAKAGILPGGYVAAKGATHKAKVTRKTVCL